MEFGALSIFQNYRDERDDADVMRDELGLALLADELGYDSYWATEHHFFGYSMCPDNLQWLAQVAGATSRIKLGTGAVIMPWNDPYRVAAKVALLDNQAEGRVLLGFGRGLARREYERFQIPMDEARGRFDQGTQLVVEALNKGYFEADTEFFSSPRVDLRPRPRAGFSDRLYAIGVSPPSAIQAAELGARLMVLAQQPWEVFKAQALDPYTERWRELRDSEPPPVVAGQLVYCDRDAGRAAELGELYVKNYFSTVVEHYEIGGTHFDSTSGYEYYATAAEFIAAVGVDKMAEMYAGVNTYGTPDEIVGKIRAQQEILGCEIDVLSIVKYGGMTQAEAESSMRLFQGEVVPALRG